MSIVTNDDFESYSAGVLHGKNGGTGWSAAWVTNDATIAVQTSVVVSGSNAVESYNNASGSNSYRYFDELSSGIYTIYARSTTTAKAWTFLWVGDGTTSSSGRACHVLFSGTDINWQYGGSYYTLVSSYSINTWYKVDAEFDCSTDQYRVRVDDGSWSDWEDFAVVAAATTLDISKMERQSSGPYYTYFDDISIDDGAVPSTENISALNSIDWANVTSVNGINK